MAQTCARSSRVNSGSGLRVAGIFLLLILAFSTNFTACSASRNLTRSRAADKIREATEFQQAKTVEVCVAQSCTVSLFEPEYPALRSLGLIEINLLQADAFTTSPFAEATVRLTLDGLRESQHWTKWEREKTTYILPIAARRLRQVTGIRYQELGSATADFDWVWVPNRYGQAVNHEIPRIRKMYTAVMGKISQQEAATSSGQKADPWSETIRMQQTLMRLQQQQMLTQILTKLFLESSSLATDESKVFKSRVDLVLYDDGWRFADKEGLRLKDVLAKSEQGEK